MHRVVLFLVVIFLGLSGGDASAAGRIIESEGVAAVTQGNLDLSRDRAIEDALRNAVEQATGSLIENQTLVENYELLSDRIYSRSRGYVQSYEVLDEKTEQGLLRVTIRATVQDGDLRNDLQALNLLMRQARKPRVMVMFESASSEIDAGKMAEAFVSKVLLDRGFKLVDPEVVRRNLDHEKIIGLLTGDEKLAAAVGARYGAEILLVGSTQTASSQVSIGDLRINSNQAVISARLIRADTGEVKVSESRQATKPHVNKLAGLQAAVREASEALANHMMDKIVQIFQEQIYNVTSVNVIIHGLTTYNQLQEVVQIIAGNVRGIKEIYQRNYSRGTAELEIELAGNGQSLATDLTSRELGNYSFDIKEITHNQLQVAITSAGH